MPHMETAESWSARQPLWFRISCAWMRWAPRAKGWLPRQIGRAFCRGDRFLISTRSGAKLAVCPDHFDIYCFIQTHNGTWEPGDLDVCLRGLRPGDVFFDIGANAGLMSIEVASTFKGQVAVHAFEPQADLAACIRASAAVSGFQSHLHVHEVLLSDQDGEVDFFLHAHAVHASLHPRTEPDEKSRAVRMPTRRLDTIASGLTPPSVIKIDVEGAELPVLRGAHEMLRAHPPMIVMEADANMERFGYRHTDLFSYLRQYADYAFAMIERDGRLRRVDDWERAPKGDYAAVPPDRMELVGLR